MHAAPIDAAVAAIKTPPHDDALLATQAVALAGELLRASQADERGAERRQGARLARMMSDSAGKAFTLAMADQVFRPPSAARSAAVFRRLVDGYGIPDYLPPAERLAMRAGALASAVAPRIVMPAITRAMRHQSSQVIFPAENHQLNPLLAQRRAAGMRMNLNQLGEAILGEDEAENRIRAILERIAGPESDAISVKISAIFSQIHLVGYDETLAAIKQRLRRLYRAAIAHPAGGRPKFINLDMEEYRDLRLTCDAFRQLLDEPEFEELEAGIVLQAYLPDSWPVQQELNAWARRRVANGGAGIKIRIVKGANLAMEAVEAELHDWAPAPYASKLEVDANFKRMLHEACLPENAAAVAVGVASHNLFDIAYTLLLRAREGVEDRIGFEMLEGMANHQARAVRRAAGGLLLYVPVVRHDDFHSAIAYLVRRLDENTAAENFLRDLFGMREGDAAWERQRQRFLDACARKDAVAAGPRRTQNRAAERHEATAGNEFHNAPDSDWSLPQNTRWIRGLVDAMRESEPTRVPLVIGGAEEWTAENAAAEDPSRPGTIPYHYALAGPAQVERALQAAVSARGDWRARGFTGRAALLRQAAAEIAAARGEGIATMVMDAGKSVTEADAEISEAIDFANHYALDPGHEDGESLEPFGTVLVTPPWNFPYAIPCGGVLAALAAGNTVILKPAPETVLTAWVMVRALWRAGIPRDVLQFLPCPDNEVGRSLVTDPRIGAVILTGAYETARLFLGWKPDLRLFAETSGKNALIITAAADPDQAVKDLVKSAFGHSGQKCSAASLAIVEAEVYDHPSFRRQLRDAAASLVVGPSWDFAATATPLIREPGEALRRALTTLEPGEEWLLEPRMIDDNRCLWSPGIKLGVAADGWFRRTECFGPVLGLIRARDLDDAIRIQNDSPFALTGGIHSLDDREIARWKEHAEVGNGYVNRPITGAIVRRQPFGGWKRSCFGPGAKAGGPNYVAQFGTWHAGSLPSQTSAPAGEAAGLLAALVMRLPGAAERLRAAAGSDAFWLAREFAISHDPSGLRCEANDFRYRRFRRTLIRVNAGDPDADLARLLLTATAIGAPFTVSTESGRGWLDGLGPVVTVESTGTLAGRLAGMTEPHDLIRCPAAPTKLRTASVAVGARLADGPVLDHARRECPAWLREQAISETRHRYGNLIPKPAADARPGPATEF
jgi:RHH-type proline utilization regulon transcriptional repressor/proline dehydrogenase/delta 1-pyrroline-5-carboxylate dehydrogenase